MPEQPDAADLNPFGEVLQRMLDERDIGAAEMARRLQEHGVPLTEDDIHAMMTARPGEEFRRVNKNLEDSVSREN